jgi:hypothetical protein
MKRFAIMAVLGAMLCGSLMVGCGDSGGGDEEAAGNAGSNIIGGNSADNGTGAGAAADEK